MDACSHTHTIWNAQICVCVRARALVSVCEMYVYNDYS